MEKKINRGDVIQLFDSTLNDFVNACFTHKDSYGNIRGHLMGSNGTVICSRLSREHEPLEVVARNNEEVIIVNLSAQ